MTNHGYINMTQRQSNNQWTDVIATQPAVSQENQNAKFRWKSSLLDFLWSRRHPPIDYLPNVKTIKAEYYLSLLVKLQDILKEKRHGKFTQFVLFLHNIAPAHRPHATHKKLTYLDSNMLISHPNLHIWPRRTTACSSDWNNNWNFAIFRPTRMSYLPQRPGWTDNNLDFVWVGYKS